MFGEQGGGMPDMQNLLAQAQKLQQDYLAAQEELAEAEVSASAGGGLVTATVSGAGELKKVAIDPKAVDPEDVETLEDLVVAAVHAAEGEAQTLAQEKLGPLAQAMGGGPGEAPGGLSLPGF